LEFFEAQEYHEENDSEDVPSFNFNSFGQPFSQVKKGRMFENSNPNSQNLKDLIMATNK
jgi:hypothetical protein